jgi:outer membrane protein OmpA-like peptidoglycan-associated protein
MQRLQTGVLALSMAVVLGGTSGCLSTRKFTRNEVKASSDALTAQMNAQNEKTQGQIKETQDSVNAVNTRVSGVDQRVTTVDTRVTGVDGKVAELDTRTTASVNGLKTDVTGVRTQAETANKNITSLDQKFQNRNNYAVSETKAVLFAFDSAALPKDGMAPLDEIAEIAKNNPDAILVLEGHTDGTGDKEYNMRLGERRIDAVRRYLAVDKGVPVYKIEQVSFGAEKPIAPNDSKEGRIQNRAVTLSILTPSGAAGTASNRE